MVKAEPESNENTSENEEKKNLESNVNNHGEADEKLSDDKKLDENMRQLINLKCIEVEEVLRAVNENISDKEVETKIEKFREFLTIKETVRLNTVIEVPLPEGETEEQKENVGAKSRSRSQSKLNSMNSKKGRNSGKQRRKKRKRKHLSRSRSRETDTSVKEDEPSPDIRRRPGSPSHLDRRRITSARKRPVPYHRPTPPPSNASDESENKK